MARPKSPPRQPPEKRRTCGSGGFAKTKTTISANAMATHVTIRDCLEEIRNAAAWGGLGASVIIQRPDGSRSTIGAPAGLPGQQHPCGHPQYGPLKSSTMSISPILDEVRPSI